MKSRRNEMEKMAVFKAATTIASPVFFNKEDTVEKVVQMASKAAGEGAQLIVFPETFIPCYPWWIWMGINSVKRAELFTRLYKNSLEIPGKEMDKLCNAARKYEIFLVIGLNERDGGTLYNSQILIDSQGNLIGKRRKLMPTGEEKTVWGWGDGSDLKVYETNLGRIGALICYEHSMPLSRFVLYSQREEIHISCWPGANFKSQPRDRKRIIDAAMRHIGFEGQVFVLFSSSCLSKEELDFYLDLDSNNKGILEPGGGIAGIIDPLGNYLAGPVEDKEIIIYAEISHDTIVKAKHMVDTVGHYARLDVARVIFDPAPRNPVEFQKRE
jgi:aliphatic nitrilase